MRRRSAQNGAVRQVIRDLPARRKVVAYILNADRLLVFRHEDDPSGRVHVPVGTVEPDESPDRAVMREAFEETGLLRLELVAYLGSRERCFVRDAERHHHLRLYYRIHAAAPVRESWRHVELDPTDGPASSVALDFWWLRLDAVTGVLAADLDAFVTGLVP